MSTTEMYLCSFIELFLSDIIIINFSLSCWQDNWVTIYNGLWDVLQQPLHDCSFFKQEAFLPIFWSQGMVCVRQ